MLSDIHGCKEEWLLAKKSKKKWTDAVELIAVSNSKSPTRLYAKEKLKLRNKDAGELSLNSETGDQIFKWDTTKVI